MSIPLTDSQDYDLVVDDGVKLFKVQVKTTTYKKDGIFQSDLRVKGGNRSGTGKEKLFDNKIVDLVFILTDEGSKYLIPSSAVTTKTQLGLGPKYEEYKLCLP